MDDDVTPIRKQYLDIKKNYPDTIVFFRLGDFYETFDQDAETTSRELDLVLTARKVSRTAKVPMAGIPYHAVENYLARLIDKGFHVAIVEQVGEQPDKGLFEREVVRVVTPGTVIEPGLLKSDANNYLLAAIETAKGIGIACADITTGEFFASVIRGENQRGVFAAELSRLRPAEILNSEKNPLAIPSSFSVTPVPNAVFDPARCFSILCEILCVPTLDGFGFSAGSPAVQAAGALVRYLDANQPATLKILSKLTPYSLDEFMALDVSTRRNLELTETLRSNNAKGSLLGVLDNTVTPMGKRAIRQWVSKPLTDIDRIRQRLDAVEIFVADGMRRAELRAAMKPLNDMERLINRITGGVAIPRDLIALQSSLEALPTIFSLLPGDLPILGRLHECAEIRGLLQRAISPDSPATLMTSGVIRRGYSEELDEVYAKSTGARDWMANLEGVERERTGLRTLKVGYNKVFGYYIEISKSLAGNAPPEYIRKQTLVNAERFITPEMKEYEALVLNAEETIRAIEGRLFAELCAEVGRESVAILETARALATLDVLTSLAESAALNHYVKPEINDSHEIEIKGGRHPVVELTMKNGERFIPNDICFKESEQIHVVTGPNMSGKSTYLRQTAIILLMAQMGSFVPADSAVIGVVDRIFTRIGAQDEIHAGLSTFMVEMVETANILNNATPRSFLILDEIGRGTSTYDGLSIAWAVVEYIHNAPQLRSRTLFATHYHELTRLAETLPNLKNYNVAVSEHNGDVVFLHKIIPGAADRSYGIHVGRIAGLPKPVINRANEILNRLEAEGSAPKTAREEPEVQMALFPETNPIVDALDSVDINVLSPIEAINLLYEWKVRFGKPSS